MKMSLFAAVVIEEMNKRKNVIDYKGDTMVLKNNKNKSKR